jgi:hypothetical protein
MEGNSKMNKLAAAKSITKFVVGKSVSGVVVTLIHNNTTTYSKSQTAQLYVGAYVMGAMVADQADNWITTQFDEMAEAWEVFKHRNDPPITVTDLETEPLVTE